MSNGTNITARNYTDYPDPANGKRVTPSVVPNDTTAHNAGTTAAPTTAAGFLLYLF